MLTPLADNLWCVEHDTYMSPARIHFRGRMTVIRLADGALLLHSPIPIDAMADALDAVGRVGHLVEPNQFHHLYLRSAIERYPEARVYGVPGLEKKAKGAVFDEMLADEAPAAWRGELEQVMVAGVPKINEVVFFHPASRSVIVTDLVMNIQQPGNWQTKMVLRMMGIHGHLGQSRLFRSLVRDKAATRESLERILAWDFDRLVMAHGEIVEDGGRQALREALAPLLERS